MAAPSWAPAVLFPRILTTSRSIVDWRGPLLCPPTPRRRRQSRSGPSAYVSAASFPEWFLASRSFRRLLEASQRSRSSQKVHHRMDGSCVSQRSYEGLSVEVSGANRFSSRPSKWAEATSPREVKCIRLVGLNTYLPPNSSLPATKS